MKTFFIAFLALPAVLAAPAPIPEALAAAAFPTSAFQCSCTDGAGKFTDGSCLNMGGVREGSWCHAGVAWAPKMEQVYTDAYCKLNNAAMPKSVCRPVELCQSTIVNNADYYQLC